MSQILPTRENLWEGIQKEKIKQIIIANIEIGHKTVKDVPKKFLKDRKSWGDSFTTRKT